MITKMIQSAIEQGLFPQNVYKYREVNDRSLDILRSHSIYFSSIDKFNDPFDCQLDERTDYTPDEVKEYLEDHQRKRLDDYTKQALLSKIGKDPSVLYELLEASDKFIYKYGVLSLSKTNDNILMWSHYAEEHKGFVIEFSLEKDLNLFTTPINMDYIDHEYEPLSYLPNPEDGIGKLIKTKYKGWEYEQEFRVMKEGCANNKVKFNPSCITGIYFGLRTKDKNIKEILKICKDSKLNVEFYKAKRKYSKFGIEFHPYP